MSNVTSTTETVSNEIALTARLSGERLQALQTEMDAQPTTQSLAKRQIAEAFKPTHDGFIDTDRVIRALSWKTNGAQDMSSLVFHRSLMDLIDLQWVEKNIKKGEAIAAEHEVETTRLHQKAAQGRKRLEEQRQVELAPFKAAVRAANEAVGTRAQKAPAIEQARAALKAAEKAAEVTFKEKEVVLKEWLQRNVAAINAHRTNALKAMWNGQLTAPSARYGQLGDQVFEGVFRLASEEVNNAVVPRGYTSIEAGYVVPKNPISTNVLNGYLEDNRELPGCVAALAMLDTLTPSIRPREGSGEESSAQYARSEERTNPVFIALEDAGAFVRDVLAEFRRANGDMDFAAQSKMKGDERPSRRLLGISAELRAAFEFAELVERVQVPVGIYADDVDPDLIAYEKKSRATIDRTYWENQYTIRSEAAIKRIAKRRNLIRFTQGIIQGGVSVTNTELLAAAQEQVDRASNELARLRVANPEFTFHREVQDLTVQRTQAKSKTLNLGLREQINGLKDLGAQGWHDQKVARAEAELRDARSALELARKPHRNGDDVSRISHEVQLKLDAAYATIDGLGGTNGHFQYLHIRNQLETLVQQAIRKQDLLDQTIKGKNAVDEKDLALQEETVKRTLLLQHRLNEHEVLGADGWYRQQLAEAEGVLARVLSDAGVTEMEAGALTERQANSAVARGLMKEIQAEAALDRGVKDAKFRMYGASKLASMVRKDNSVRNWIDRLNGIKAELARYDADYGIDVDLLVAKLADSLVGLRIERATVTYSSRDGYFFTVDMDDFRERQAEITTVGAVELEAPAIAVDYSDEAAAI